VKDFGVFALLLTRFQGDSKELITGSAVSFSVKLLAAVTALVVNILIARRLGAEQAGLYYLGLSIVTLLSLISVFGLNHILVRQIAQFSIDDQLPKIHGALLQSILITLPISSVLTILLFSCSDVIADVFSKTELAPIIRWLAIGLPVITIITLFAFSFQGLKKFFLYTILQNPLTQMLIALNIVFLMRPELAIDLAKVHLLSLFCVLFVNSLIPGHL